MPTVLPLVGGCLQPFWQTWAHLGANPRVVSILKEGYVLPFKLKPPLVRYPLIVSGYAHSLREAVQTLLHKKAVDMVRVRASLAFFNRLFIVPKPNQKSRPILDLSALNKFLSVKTFKMETPETFRISLQQGEWVTSLDFSDAYFHTPIHTGSRKYLRFHFQNQSYQFRALPFGLSTAPMEFTCVVKEVKLMAQSRGISIHQYLDDWLIRAPTKESCHHGTQSLLALCQELGWVVNLQKSDFRVCGLEVRSLSRTGQTDPEPLGVDSPKGGIHSIQTNLPSQEIYVPDRPAHSNRKTGTPGETPHEAHPLAPQKTLESPRISRKGDSSSKVSSPAPSMVDQEDKCLDRLAFGPFVSCHSKKVRIGINPTPMLGKVRICLKPLATSGKDKPAWKTFGGRGRSRGRGSGGPSGRGSRVSKDVNQYK